MKKRKAVLEARKDNQNMEGMTAKGVQEFFERVATDWDTMRLSYYDERVIERMAAKGSYAWHYAAS